jgi:tRNA pseudouridine55 synthase
MSVVNDIKFLASNSRLFADPSKPYRTNKGNKGKKNHDSVKIGQGGTLDPLADGVLGDISFQ